MPSNVNSLQVAANFFTLLGSNALLGRTLDSGDYRLGRRVAVLSHRLWVSRFAADAQVIGRTIQLDNRSYEIAGVMPAAFRCPPGAPQVPGLTCEMWEPWIPAAEEQTGRKSRPAPVLARIQPGHSLEHAKAELLAVMAQLAQKYPGTNAGWTARFAPVAEGVTKSLRPAMMLLVAAVALVLLIACANVANLLLARSTARLREIALRVALGASHSRLLMQTVAENVVLAAAGGGLGLVGAHWSLRAMVPFFPHNVPRIEQIGIDRTVLFTAAGLSLLTAVLIALVPALALMRLELAGAMQAEVAAPNMLPGSIRLTSAFVVLQVAVSLVLLVGAALMIRTLSALYAVDMGFRPDPVLTVRLSPPIYQYRSLERVREFHRQVLQEVQSQPGVASAALVMTLPLSGRSSRRTVSTESSETEHWAESNVVTPDYFRVMQIALWRGRVFGAEDRDKAERVVILNRALASAIWPTGEPAGRRIRTAGEWLTVVGVVQDEKHAAIDKDPEPKFYVPYDQDRVWLGSMRVLTFLVLRTANDPLSFATQTRRAIWSVDKTMPLDDVKTMSLVVADSIAIPRFRAILLGALALLALIVSMVGVYGVMAYSVTRRIRDIGIRTALGAHRHHILGGVLFNGLRLAAIGTILGLLLSAALTRFVRNQLFGVQPLDAWAFGGAAGLLLLVAALACLIPARRATRVDPLVALRHS